MMSGLSVIAFRTPLTNAASIASLLLTTEALVSEIPEKEKPPRVPHGPGMDDD